MDDAAELPNAEVLVATTWECNLRCSYCFVKERTSNSARTHMSDGIARRLIEVLDQGMDHVESICIHLYGGEPLTNVPAMKALVEAAEAAPSGRFSFAVTTNGTLLSEQILDLLEQGDFQIILSIDGPPEVHDSCRLSHGDSPTHHKVMRFLDAVKSRTRCWVRGSSVVRKGWRLRDAERYLRQLPVDSIKAQAIRVDDMNPLALSAEERVIYFEDLDAVAKTVIDELEMGKRPIDDRFSNRVLQLLAGDERDRFCGAGSTTFGFMPDGRITPCVLLDGKEHRLGHIDQAPSKWIEAGKQWRRSSGARKECQQCEAKPLCGGGCPAILPVCGANECDTIRKNCEVAKNIYRHFAGREEMLLPLAGIV